MPGSRRSPPGLQPALFRTFRFPPPKQRVLFSGALPGVKSFPPVLLRGLLFGTLQFWDNIERETAGDPIQEV